MINDQRSMIGLRPDQQAMKALQHLLNRIRDDSRVGWYLGHGTETFALATEAFATLFKDDLVEVRTSFSPQSPADPAKEAIADLVEQYKFRLCDDECALLEKIASYHEAMSETARVAANTAKMQLGYGLHAQADKHDKWAEELRAIAAAKGRAS